MMTGITVPGAEGSAGAGVWRVCSELSLGGVESEEDEGPLSSAIVSFVGMGGVEEEVDAGGALELALCLPLRVDDKPCACGAVMEGN